MVAPRRALLGVGVISNQLVRIHINAGRHWFREKTHPRGDCTSELAKPHVDAGFMKHEADRPNLRTLRYIPHLGAFQGKKPVCLHVFAM